MKRMRLVWYGNGQKSRMMRHLAKISGAEISEHFAGRLYEQQGISVACNTYRKEAVLPFYAKEEILLTAGADFPSSRVTDLREEGYRVVLEGSGDELALSTVDGADYGVVEDGGGGLCAPWPFEEADLL